MDSQVLQNQIAVGEILAGKYRVERVLGVGGMGVVVAATHLDLREERAIKLVRPDLTNPQLLERFLREARLVVKLRSEHVAQVYDIGRLECGAPFIVMELLHGQDLAALIRHRGPLPIQEAVLYIMQTCDALSDAHARGIIHRDLKPANLFLTQREDGSPCVKVLDFGVSKCIPQEGEAADAEMTNNGDIMGSPLYMAPEQMRAAREVDPRADIWALGAILFKLLTGQTPFQGATTPEIFMRVLGNEAARPPSSYRRAIPAGLDAVILRCLQKNVDARFSRAADLKAALSPYLARRESMTEEEGLQCLDEPRSSRSSNSSRPIPRNIDAILLGVIGKDSKARAARAPGRKSGSDPFFRSVASSVPPEPRAVLPSEPPRIEADPDTTTTNTGTVAMSQDELRAASDLAFGKTQFMPKAAEPLPVEGLENPTALLPPRLPTFPAPPPTGRERTVQMPHASLLGPNTAASEPSGNSVAPWGYSPAPPSASRAKPIALLASAMTAAFVVFALVLAFTTGGQTRASAEPRTEPIRPAAGGLPAPLPASPETSSAAPNPSASAAAKPSD